MTAYPEPMVARVMGVHRETLANTRKTRLAKGGDWTLENSVVCYTAPGLEKLLGALGLAGRAFAWERPATGPGDPTATPPSAGLAAKKISGTVAAGVEAADAVAATRPLVALRVTRISRNPSIVHAQPAAGAEVMVRVRANGHFTAGMTIQARAPAAGSTLYHFEGNCPRWKGRY